ncbi:MAG: TSUP family transporter, partial [Planctomycetota bacterium]
MAMYSVYLFLFITSLISGLCAIIGFAGGIILSPLLLYIYPHIFTQYPLSVKDITNITIIHSLIASGGGAIVHQKLYKEINIPALKLGTIPILIGSILGTFVGLRGNNIFVFTALFIMTSFAFLSSLFQKKTPVNNNNVIKYKFFYMVMLLLVPFISNITGLGGGFIFMAIHAYLERWNIFVASSTSLAFNALS